MRSSSPPRTDGMDIDSPIADLDSPIGDFSRLSGRPSIASSVHSVHSPSRDRAGIRGNRPSQQYMQSQQPINNNANTNNINNNNNNNDDFGGDGGGLQTTIWGTNVNLDDIHRSFLDFIQNFKKNGILFYPALIETAIESESWNVNLDCQNLHSHNAALYTQLCTFPQEILPALDEVINSFARSEFSELFSLTEMDKDIWCRPFNLLDTHVSSMRDMNPSSIDELLSICGMIIRCTSVIPDIHTAFFQCILCSATVCVAIDMGRIESPTKCTNELCKGSHTMELIHNRCTFKDKQLIKVQESPEHIPDGETPQTIDVYVYDQLVDFVKPGDRVTITGVYRASAIRKNNRRRTVESVYKTYIDSVHIVRGKQAAQQLTNEISAQFNAQDSVTELENLNTERMKELGNNPDIYRILVKSLAPSVYEMEDIKKGILCQLFGASSSKKFGPQGTNSPLEGRTRAELNVLLCGDPGTSKSQLLKYVDSVAPRGIYTSGKGSSAVGLTAYITKDHDTGDLVLESGALVLSDMGICCIDEFDKMSHSARSILHEVMEQQTVSIAKAGIICTLNARTSILAAANPIESRYNPSKSVIENIDLPPTLMSRFDLIYLVLDRPNQNLDRKLAQHIVSLYYDQNDKNERTQTLMDDGIAVLKQEELMQYISYSRKEIQPKISQLAADKLVEAYVEMRSLGRIRAKKTITATPRQLESLIRISESLAKMNHSQTVDIEHVNEAVRLHKVATMAAATDPRTGAIDLDSINVGPQLQMQAKAQDMLLLIRNAFANETHINAQALLMKMNDQQSADDEQKLSMIDLKNIVNILQMNNKVRVNDWLNDNVVISVLDTSDL